jgi:hypothetical protein
VLPSTSRFKLCALLFYFGLLLSSLGLFLRQQLISELEFGFTFGRLCRRCVSRLQELLGRSSHNLVPLHRWPSTSSATRLALSPASYSPLQFAQLLGSSVRIFLTLACDVGERSKNRLDFSESKSRLYYSSLSRGLNCDLVIALVYREFYLALSI